MRKRFLIGGIVLFFLFSLFIVSGDSQTLSKVSNSTCKWVEKLHTTNADSPNTVIAVDPVSPNIIYTGSGSNFYKSTNYGSTWIKLGNGVPDDRVCSIAVDKANHKIVYVSGIKKSGETGLYKTTDGGATWHRVLGAHTWNSQIAIDPKNHNRVYVLNADHGYVYRSDDGGVHWTQVNLGIKYFVAIAINPVHTNIVYVGGNNKFLKSTDYGNTWTDPNPTFETNKYFRKFVIDPSNENAIYAKIYNTSVSRNELYYSSNGGASWSKISGGYYITDFDINPKHPSTVYISDWKHGIFKTVDRGVHWTPINNGFQGLSSVDYRIITVDPVHPTVLYCRVTDPGSNNFKNPRTYRYTCPVDAPTNFAAYFTGNDINFSWKYPKDADIDYFEIKYKQAGSSNYHLLAKVSESKRYYKKPNFTATNTTFDFIISAVRETERSYWKHDSARHLMKPSITRLAVYSNTSTSSKLKLTWNKASIDSNADYIEIFRNDPDCSGFLCFPVFIKKINKGSADFNNGYTYIEGLKFDKQYKIYLNVYKEGNGNGVDTSSDYESIFIPDIPKNFEAYVTGNKLHFIWSYDTSSASHIDNFKVFMLSPNLSTLGTVAKTGRTLTIDASYTGKGIFLVSAYKGSSHTNSALDFAYVLKKPDAPALSVVDGHIKIKWDKTRIDQNANKIMIYRSVSGNTFSLIMTVDKNLEEVIDSSVSPNTAYYYILKAERKVSGKHADISPASSAVRIKITPPTAPTNLTASASSCSEARLSWTDNSDNEEHFVVERKEEGGTYAELEMLDPDTTTYTDSSVEGEKLYYYRVKAVNSAGDSGYSNEARVSVPECKTMPDAPTNLIGSAVSESEVHLSWSDNSDNEDGFKIERKEEGGTYSVIATVNTNVSEYRDAGLSADTLYYYRVKAFNSKGESDYSNEVSVRTKSTPDTTPPVLTIASPTNFETVNEDTVTVSGTATDGESGIDTVTVNGNSVTIGSDGSFSLDVSLSEGENAIKVIAIDKAGNKTTKTVIVKYEKNNPPPEKEKIIITLQPDNPHMTVNGIMQEIDPGRGTKPVIIPKWSRTVVPIRAIVEALGGTIEWDGTERKVTIHFNGTTVELWIDNPKAKVNGVTKWIDGNNHNVKPIIINGRTMLPLRFVAESLGCKVDWDSATRTITITYMP